MGNCGYAVCCKSDEVNLEDETNHSNPPVQNLILLNKQDNLSDNLTSNNFISSLRSGNLPSYNFDDEEYIKIENEIFTLINEIKTNPDNYINESKIYNLFSIFIKLKPSIEYKKSDLQNIKYIKSYLFSSLLQEKKLLIKENEILKLIPEQIRSMDLFQCICDNRNVNEIVWKFLEDNEDDIESILGELYESLLVIFQPGFDKSQYITYFIFYTKM